MFKMIYTQTVTKQHYVDTPEGRHGVFREEAIGKAIVTSCVLRDHQVGAACLDAWNKVDCYEHAFVGLVPLNQVKDGQWVHTGPYEGYRHESAHRRVDPH